MSHATFFSAVGSVRPWLGITVLREWRPRGPRSVAREVRREDDVAAFSQLREQPLRLQPREIEKYEVLRTI
jgi:hypothetical protein